MAGNPNPSPATRFQPGVCPNPGGRPKTDPALIAQIRAQAPELVDALIKSGLGATRKPNVKAIMHALDRIMGPVVPKDPIQVDMTAIIARAAELIGNAKVDEPEAGTP